MIGVPILAVLEKGDSADAVYLGRALLIWIFSVSGVASVVGTKVYKALMERWYPEAKDDDRVHVSGLESQPASSLRSSMALRRQSSAASLLSNRAFRPSAKKHSSTRTLSGPDSSNNSVGSSPLSLDALHSSFGTSPATGSLNGSGLFDWNEEAVMTAEKRWDSGEGSSELQLSLPSADSEVREDESLNKSGQLSVALFSLNEDDEETERSEMQDAPATTPAA